MKEQPEKTQSSTKDRAGQIGRRGLLATAAALGAGAVAKLAGSDRSLAHPAYAAVPGPDGSLLTLYSLESPEAYFEDFGDGRLQNGAARVEIERDFVPLIDNQKYRVFLTAEGDCNGLYVTARGPEGFEVRELQGGTHSLSFTYRIVAKRKDIAAPRLAKIEAPKPFELKQYTPPEPLTLPPEQVFPEQNRPRPEGPAIR